MYKVPENAYPSASFQLLEAVRAMTRVKEHERRSAGGARGLYKWYAGSRILEQLLADPLASRNLHRVNWNARRPRLFVRIYISDRNDELVIDALSSPQGVMQYYLGPFSMGRQVEVGDFQEFPVWERDYGCPILRLSIDGDLTGSDYGFRYAGRLLVDPKLREERHLCTLLVQAKLHQLSQHFDVTLMDRLVEWGDDNWLHFRDCDEKAPSPKPYLGVDEWLPNPLWDLLAGSGIGAKDLYAFAAQALAEAAPKRRVSLLAGYLANSHAHRVTAEHVNLLLKLLDTDRRTAQRLKEIEKEPIRLKNGADYEANYERTWFIEGFARDAGMEIDAAFDWLLKFQPHLFATLKPPSKYLRKCLEPVKRGVWRLDERIRAQLDAQLAAELWPARYFYRGRSALSDLDMSAKRLNFESFEELRAWTGKNAQQSAVAAANFEAYVHHEHAKAKEAATAKRKATTAKRRAAEQGGAT